MQISQSNLRSQIMTQLMMSLSDQWTLQKLQRLL